MLPVPGEPFPDIELPDSRGIATRLSSLTRPGAVDERVGFTDGYPLILIFYRGFFCPRDQQQMRNLVAAQAEFALSSCKIAAISVDPPPVAAAFRAGLGATWTFLSDPDRAAIKRFGILDATEGEYPDVSRPFTLVLSPGLAVRRVWDGWWFAGRPTVEELRMEVRKAMEPLSNYGYAAWDKEAVSKIRIPAREWAAGLPELGKSGLPVARGTVSAFDLGTGNGTIARRDGGGEVFFNFTAIPGTGYRTVRAGDRVVFEVVENATGPTARNVRADKDGA
ncbi:cold-shock DNA-binding domain protein [Hyaloraphidium curvatum]|nr:cold-shock DNA-binding domain protein [Hyaloraphidium curvatum]